MFQKMTDGPARKCPVCGKLKLKRQIGTGAGIIFKGSGFYETDYKRKSGGNGSAGSSSSKPSPTPESQSESKSETKPESKPESKSGSKSEKTKSEPGKPSAGKASG